MITICIIFTVIHHQNRSQQLMQPKQYSIFLLQGLFWFFKKVCTHAIYKNINIHHWPQPQAVRWDWSHTTPGIFCLSEDSALEGGPVTQEALAHEVWVLFFTLQQTHLFLQYQVDGLLATPSPFGKQEGVTHSGLTCLKGLHWLRGPLPKRTSRARNQPGTGRRQSGSRRQLLAGKRRLSPARGQCFLWEPGDKVGILSLWKSYRNNIPTHENGLCF